MSNLVTVNSGSAIDGSLKAGRVAISTDSTVNPSSGGKTWYNMINPAEGYVFISDPKVQGYNDGPPIIYPTQTSLPTDILATINGLPDRRGSVPFDNVWDALSWLGHNGKYFLLDKTLNGIIAEDITMYMSPESLASYPQSGSTVYNLGGTANGTLANGPVWSYDGYFDFDGTDDYLTLGSSAASLVQGKTAVTMGILFKLDATASLRGLIGTLNYGCGQNLGLVASGTSLSFYNDYSSTCYSVSRTIVETGKWIFAVGTYDGTTTKIYGIKDGTMYTSSGGSKTGATNTFSSTFRVMGNHYSSYFTNGQCAQAFVYDRALSEDEIWDLYYKSSIVTDNLVFSTDPGNLASYSKVGSTMYSLKGSHAGTINNATYFSYPYQGYFSYDGADDYIEFPDSDDFTFSDAVATWEAWVRPTGNAGVLEHTIMTKANYSYNTREYQFQVRYSSGIYYFYLGQQNNNTSWKPIGSTTTSAIEINEWYHVLVTSDGSGNAQMYINGELRDTATGWHTSQANLGAPLCIGATINATNPIQEFVGDIAICRLYKKHFLQEDVSQNYNAELPRFKSSRDISKEGLILDLDAGNPNSYLSGTTWTDLSNNGNNGTLTNSPVYNADNGGVFTFDGVDDYVALGNLNTNIYHISLWVYLDSDVTSATTSTGLFYYGGSGITLQSGVSFGAATGFLSNETLTILNENPSATYQRTGIFDTIPAGWRYISFNWNGSSYDIYIDGDKKTTSAGSSAGHAPLMIASDFELASNFNSTPQFEGKIASVKIYDQALNEYQIVLNYTSQTPRYQVQIPRSVTDTLKLNLDAGDTTSYPRTGTTWYDRSGNGNNATLYNSPTYTIAEGGVFDLDGTDDYFIAPASAAGMYNFGTDGTLEMWFRPDASFTTNHRLMCVTNNASAIDIYIASSGILYLHGNKAYASSNTIPINEWTHLMVTYIGGTVQIYFNGEAQTMAGTQLTGYNITNNNQLFIGQFSGGGSYYFNGKIANAKIYHRGLNPSEVLENYKSTRSRFGTDGIVTSNLQFNLDAGDINSFDNSGTTWYDLSSNSFNGTLTNGPTFNPYNGGNIEFDGTNDYVDFGTQFLLPGISLNGTINNLTIEAWVKWDQFSANGAYDEIISWWKSGTQVYSDGFLGTSVIGGGSTTYPVIRFGDGWANTGVTFTASEDVNKWFHIVAVKTTSNAYVYVNGELRATKGSSLSWGFNGYGTIGKHSSGGSEYIDGEIAVVRLYDTNLSSTQILQNYNAERNRFGLD